MDTHNIWCNYLAWVPDTYILAGVLPKFGRNNAMGGHNVCMRRAVSTAVNVQALLF